MWYKEYMKSILVVFRKTVIYTKYLNMNKNVTFLQLIMLKSAYTVNMTVKI